MSRSFLVFALLCGLGMVPSARAELGDPTRPPDISTVSVESLESGEAPFRVSSILMAPGRKIAIVNESRVEVGDEVGGATVSEINAQAVLLEMGGEEIELRISGQPIKVIAKSDYGEEEE